MDSKSYADKLWEAAGRGGGDSFPFRMPRPSELTREPIEFVDTPTSKVFKNLAYYDAYMLATLPRNRGDEPTSTPLACTLTAAIPAIISFFHAFHESQPYFDMDLTGYFETLLFLGCMLWFFIRMSDQKNELNSREYLEWLLAGGEKPAPKSREWWKLWGD